MIALLCLHIGKPKSIASVSRNATRAVLGAGCDALCVLFLHFYSTPLTFPRLLLHFFRSSSLSLFLALNTHMQRSVYARVCVASEVRCALEVYLENKNARIVLNLPRRRPHKRRKRKWRRGTKKASSDGDAMKEIKKESKDKRRKKKAARKKPRRAKGGKENERVCKSQRETLLAVRVCECVCVWLWAYVSLVCGLSPIPLFRYFHLALSLSLSLPPTRWSWRRTENFHSPFVISCELH